MNSTGRVANKFPTSVCRGGGVRGGSGRLWDDMSVDLLVAIFSRVGVEDLIACVPYVCSAWRNAAREPLCWQSLDFRNWNVISYRVGCQRDAAVDFADLLDFAISRGNKFIVSIYLPQFANQIDLNYVANWCPELRYFSIPNPNISEDEFFKAIGKFEFLVGMAVDESLICHRVLQHVNQCCSNFTELKVFTDTMDAAMAAVICESLPSLQKLEITDCLISRDAVLILLDGLKQLSHLDISGYEISGITSEVIKKASKLKVFRWDSKYELGEFRYCSYCEHELLDHTPCECVLDQQFMEWLANIS
ncbi:hypothetical protein HPP92_012377 [Vanilla planifolia]|uniref:F-box domain-containing protein n=1 Tax=Vanilla planifolia TaxID=51239 RepID=A0A835QZC7_VANPL|nr:hypothetical protein HPP92_012377 [Vanilla planifolia]